MRQCSEPDCDKPHMGRGLCRPHYMQEFQRTHRAQLREYHKEYREDNQEKLNAAARVWYRANREKWAEWQRQYRQDNQEKLNATARVWYRANREKRLVAAAKQRRARPEKDRERVRAWKKANPDKMQAAGRNSKAKRSAAGGDGVSTSEWAALVEAANERCFYCGERPDQLQMDHVIPLTPRNGDEPGQHSFENVLPACGPCNGSKHNRPLDEWYGPAVQYLRRKHRRLVRQARGLLDAWDAA